MTDVLLKLLGDDDHRVRHAAATAFCRYTWTCRLSMIIVLVVAVLVVVVVVVVRFSKNSLWLCRYGTDCNQLRTDICDHIPHQCTMSHFKINAQLNSILCLKKNWTLVIFSNISNKL